jgi:hypothetical protein
MDFILDRSSPLIARINQAMNLPELNVVFNTVGTVSDVILPEEFQHYLHQKLNAIMPEYSFALIPASIKRNLHEAKEHIKKVHSLFYDLKHSANKVLDDIYKKSIPVLENVVLLNSSGLLFIAIGTLGLYKTESKPENNTKRYVFSAVNILGIGLIAAATYKAFTASMDLRMIFKTDVVANLTRY